MTHAPLRIIASLLAGAVVALGCGSCAQTGMFPLALSEGVVVAVGGGGTPPVVPFECVRIARARFQTDRVRVLVIPHASAREERGAGSAEMWAASGRGVDVSIMNDDPVEARAQLERAHIVWMGGGSQNRLLDHLEEHDLVGPMRAAHARGAVVGGTSAGAAVLGSTTISGRPSPAPYIRGSVERRSGLGFVQRTIVDQHFAERGREGRLLTCVFDGSRTLGVGISERTAVFFEGRSLRTVGEGIVLVVDARDTDPLVVDPIDLIDPIDSEDSSDGNAREPKQLCSASGARVHLLAPGQDLLLPR